MGEVPRIRVKDCSEKSIFLDLLAEKGEVCPTVRGHFKIIQYLSFNVHATGIIWLLVMSFMCFNSARQERVITTTHWHAKSSLSTRLYVACFTSSSILITMSV